MVKCKSGMILKALISAEASWPSQAAARARVSQKPSPICHLDSRPIVIT